MYVRHLTADEPSCLPVHTYKHASLMFCKPLTVFITNVWKFFENTSTCGEMLSEVMVGHQIAAICHDVAWAIVFFYAGIRKKPVSLLFSWHLWDHLLPLTYTWNTETGRHFVTWHSHLDSSLFFPRQDFALWVISEYWQCFMFRARNMLLMMTHWGCLSLIALVLQFKWCFKII